MSTTNALTAAASTSAAATTSKAATSQKKIADDFDQFLLLLTTQLKNQSPLEPLDTNQFTQQLVQFAGVEQQITTNKSLEDLVATNKSSTLTNALGFVGARVTADGTKTRLQNSKASWQVSAPKSGTATINVTDKTGATVFSAQRVVNSGDQTFTWDGRNTSGLPMPDGEYSIQISARDAGNQPMTVKTEMSGIVDTVDVSGDNPVLKIGDISINMSDVRSIRRN